MNAEETTSEQVRDRINQRISNILNELPDGKVVPFVCLICDVLVSREDVKQISEKKLKDVKKLLVPSRNKNGWNYVSPELEANYKYNGYGCKPWMKDMLLSPRGSFYKGRSQSRYNGFTSCSRCKSALEQSRVPQYAIVNNMAFGTPPPCLTELNDTELAFLSPVKTYGYCFSYAGGKMMNLKGSLSYYKVNVNDIARHSANFIVTGLNEHVVILLSGQLTPEQRQKAKLYCAVRTNKIIDAVTWLCQNHHMWSNVNIIDVVTRLEQCKPVVIDESTEVNGSVDEENRNTEATFQFSVYYPDGNVNTFSGGQKDNNDFKELIQQLKTNYFDVEVKCDIEKNAVSDYVEDNLAGACLLQFPYGRGGLSEKRQNGDGAVTDKTDVSAYVKHLANISQPHFHRPLMALILYNLSARQTMLRMASLKLRGKTNAANIASLLNANDLEDAILARQRGTNSGSSISRAFLYSVDAITRCLPHTNEAAKRARGDLETLQHHFGLPTHFLTATFDDDNSWLVQVYSGIVVDDDTPVHLIPDDELQRRAHLRTELRLKFPGRINRVLL